MATETFFLPGYGIVVDEEDGDEYFLPDYGVVANEGATAVVSGNSGRTRYTFLDPVPDEEDPEFVRKIQFTVGQSRGALDRRAAFARHALSIINGGKK